MKKIVALTAAVVFALGLTACGDKKELAEESQSTLFSEEDFCEAQEEITDWVKEIDCVTLNIDYNGDDVCKNKNTLAALNNELDLKADECYTGCMKFTVAYRQSYSPIVAAKSIIRDGNVDVDFSEKKVYFTVAKRDNGDWETADVSLTDAG